MTSYQLSAKDEMVEKFLDAAAGGDVSRVSGLLSHLPSLINQTGYSGWTALMLAARNGHRDVVEKLLAHGWVAPSLCNVSVPFLRHIFQAQVNSRRAYGPKEVKEAETKSGCT